MPPPSLTRPLSEDLSEDLSEETRFSLRLSLVLSLRRLPARCQHLLHELVPAAPGFRDQGSQLQV